MRVTVIGASGLIGRALQELETTNSWLFLDHEQALHIHGWAPLTSTIINCAFDNRLKNEAYRSDLDFDLRLAKLLAPYHDIKYVMLSSRTVYGQAKKGGQLLEHQRPEPASHYGNAKLQTEKRLSELLGDRLTILRLGNIFGLELQAFRRNFFAIALQSLRDKSQISLDVCPFVERDFLAATDFAIQLALIAKNPSPGIFNVGAGLGTPVGRIAQWLIEGYGRGQLVITDMREFDDFWLNVEKAKKAFQLPSVTSSDIQCRCTEIGQKLRSLNDGKQKSIA